MIRIYQRYDSTARPKVGAVGNQTMDIFIIDHVDICLELPSVVGIQLSDPTTGGEYD